MCHCGNMGVERTPNKSQHTNLTLEKKILPPLLPGFELATFRSRVRHSANELSRLPRLRLENEKTCAKTKIFRGTIFSITMTTTVVMMMKLMLMMSIILLRWCHTWVTEDWSLDSSTTRSPSLHRSSRSSLPPHVPYLYTQIQSIQCQPLKPQLLYQKAWLFDGLILVFISCVCCLYVCLVNKKISEFIILKSRCKETI